MRAMTSTRTHRHPNIILLKSTGEVEMEEETSMLSVKEVAKARAASSAVSRDTLPESAHLRARVREVASTEESPLEESPSEKACGPQKV